MAQDLNNTRESLHQEGNESERFLVRHSVTLQVLLAGGSRRCSSQQPVTFPESLHFSYMINQVLFHSYRSPVKKVRHSDRVDDAGIREHEKAQCTGESISKVQAEAWSQKYYSITAT